MQNFILTLVIFFLICSCSPSQSKQEGNEMGGDRFSTVDIEELAESKSDINLDSKVKDSQILSQINSVSSELIKLGILPDSEDKKDKWDEMNQQEKVEKIELIIRSIKPEKAELFEKQVRIFSEFYEEMKDSNSHFGQDIKIVRLHDISQIALNVIADLKKVVSLTFNEFEVFEDEFGISMLEIYTKTGVDIIDDIYLIRNLENAPVRGYPFNDSILFDSYSLAYNQWNQAVKSEKKYLFEELLGVIKRNLESIKKLEEVLLVFFLDVNNGNPFSNEEDFEKLKEEELNLTLYREVLVSHQNVIEKFLGLDTSPSGDERFTKFWNGIREKAETFYHFFKKESSPDF